MIALPDKFRAGRHVGELFFVGTDGDTRIDVPVPVELSIGSALQAIPAQLVIGENAIYTAEPFSILLKALNTPPVVNSIGGLPASAWMANTTFADGTTMLIFTEPERLLAFAANPRLLVQTNQGPIVIALEIQE